MPLELCKVRGEVAVFLVDCEQSIFRVSNPVRVTEGVFQDVDQGSEVDEVHFVVFDIWEDLDGGGA